MTTSARTRRDLLSLTLAIAAGVHAALAPEHWGERPVLGVGFALATLALLAVAVWLQLDKSRRPALSAVPLLAGLVALFLLTRTSGLPVIGLEQWDTLGVLTQAVELAGLGLALSLAGLGFPRPFYLQGATNV